MTFACDPCLSLAIERPDRFRQRNTQIPPTPFLVDIVIFVTCFVERKHRTYVLDVDR